MKPLFVVLGMLAALVGIGGARPARAEAFLEAYPELKKFVATERDPGIYFGFGMSPFTLINGRIGMSANLFQLHWIKDSFDLELFSLSFGNVFGGTYGSEQLFTLRTVPKFQLGHGFSIGPLIGLEFVHYSDVSEKIFKNNLAPPNSVAFSTSGPILGGVLSQSFSIGKGSFLKLNEMLYREKYSADGTNQGWVYHYDQAALNTDHSAIGPSTVFMLEFSYLY